MPIVVKQQSRQTEKELCPVLDMVGEFNLLMTGWTDFSLLRQKGRKEAALLAIIYNQRTRFLQERKHRTFYRQQNSSLVINELNKPDSGRKHEAGQWQARDMLINGVSSSGCIASLRSHLK